jgi:hypothetical protein
MGQTSQGKTEGLAVAGGLPISVRLLWPLLLAAEGLMLAGATSSVNIPPLVVQIFRALLTF